MMTKDAAREESPAPIVPPVDNPKDDTPPEPEPMASAAPTGPRFTTPILAGHDAHVSNGGPGGATVHITSQESRALAATGCITPPTIPAPPTSVTATALIGGVRVSFLAPSNVGKPAIGSYVATTSSGHSASGVAAPIDIMGLPAEEITVTVQSVSYVGKSVPSTASAPVTPSAP